MLKKISTKIAERKTRKREKILEKNRRLRAEGKDPLKGWNRMVNTGLGGLNRGGTVSNTVVNPLDKNTEGTYNYFGEEQKNIAKEAEQRQKNKPESDR
ncbi:hypothetical protein IGI37_003164 [Enterococcus sp. AZ194]|uniref:hypothetical protein n=1 Tax=Enterococcus sp. AZ194 TaxID=2774629 RepID=UPI003F25A320